MSGNEIETDTKVSKRRLYPPSYTEWKSVLKEETVMESSSAKEYNGTVIESKQLFKNDNSIRILHGNEVYTLRITKGNKLILTK